MHALEEMENQGPVHPLNPSVYLELWAETAQKTRLQNKLLQPAPNMSSNFTKIACALVKPDQLSPGLLTEV